MHENVHQRPKKANWEYLNSCRTQIFLLGAMEKGKVWKTRKLRQVLNHEKYPQSFRVFPWKWFFFSLKPEKFSAVFTAETFFPRSNVFILLNNQFFFFFTFLFIFINFFCGLILDLGFVSIYNKYFCLFFFTAKFHLKLFLLSFQQSIQSPSRVRGLFI